jgi:glycosyltransferase involved in cell wall biosynthesis
LNKVINASVIMSVYNNEDTIVKCVESIVNQTNNDFEFLIIDDNSTDYSYEILKKLDNQYHQIKLFKNNKNIGLTKSLNQLIGEASGDYVFRQDGDDYSDINRLDKQLDVMYKYNLDFCTTRAINLQDNNIIPGYSHYLPYKYLLKYKNPFIHGSLCIKMEAILEIGKYDELFYYSQDYKLFSDLIQRKYKFKVINKPLYFLNTVNNISSNNKKEQEYYANCVKNKLVPNEAR